MRCTSHHEGPFHKSPNPHLHGWIFPVWLRCEACGSDIGPAEVLRQLRLAGAGDTLPYPLSVTSGAEKTS